MNEIKINWNKVTPADLSSTCCPHYFAFSKNGKVFHFDQISASCLFTEVIKASTNFSQSLYEMDIWIGRCANECESQINALPDSKAVLDAVEWSIRMQLMGLSVAHPLRSNWAVSA